MAIRPRVHEISKGFGVSSKEILSLMEGFGITLKNHMTILEEKELDILLDYYTQKNMTDDLNRVFSSLTGSPVFAYLNILRINNAKQLISTTDLPFSEIAYLVGIEDRYYFSKLFRKMTGMSPTEYYKEVRS